MINISNLILTISTGIVFGLIVVVPIIWAYFFWLRPRRLKKLAIKELDNNPKLKKEVMKNDEEGSYRGQNGLGGAGSGITETVATYRGQNGLGGAGSGITETVATDRDREYKPESGSGYEESDSDTSGFDRKVKYDWPEFK